MPVKLDTGFAKADSTNLPKVNCFMVWAYIVSNEKYNAPEVKGIKATLSSRESYGDSAVGYVSVHGAGALCTVKGEVCPEQRRRNKDYTVILSVDEKNEMVKDLACVGDECKASEGGCKHCIAFLMWVNRRF
ncbi:hypothetical protein QAD02_009360 [Eretmocerus hayati]|uniref:Uncharacterized protein n=1 Tax=Eretmocerus hayati TaxID=131215 RepID=A0ACC2N965_9HYME|nr:hypothetical protein QAD02_009360 [Eretmocerus hayati]